MNSETPQNHESRNNQSPEFIEISEEELTLEEIDHDSEPFPDVWSTSDDDIIDVEPDVEDEVDLAEKPPEAVDTRLESETETETENLEDSDRPETENSTNKQKPESEPEPWLEEETENLESGDKEISEVDLAENQPVDTWLEEETENSESNDQAIAETEDSTNGDGIESAENSPEAIDTWLETENLESTDEAIAQAEPSTSQTLESESELVADSWLDESVSAEDSSSTELETEPNQELTALERQKAQLNNEIEQLKAQKTQIILQQTKETQEMLGRMVEEGTKELKERRNYLQIEIEKLERRRERINQEMRTNFAGASQELAIRVQGFKDYLVGSLQDLALAAEQLEINRVEPPQPPRERERSRRQEPRRDRREGVRDSRRKPENSSSPIPQFTEQAFAEQTKRIRSLINQYRSSPDYYGSPWQLRRTFEPVHATKVQDWFFTQGGRGAIDSMGSRLQNILIASAIISIVRNLYGDRCKVLVLIDTPEKLGEWRRGLQDCLGISRSDFGTNQGVVLFDAAEVLAQRAERLVKEKQLPLIIIDETEELVNLALLKFPLWLAFASGAKPTNSNYLY
ncbi:MAG: hypothetical protein Tsb0014_18840 [Pleurocapsa sp.]